MMLPKKIMQFIMALKIGYSNYKSIKNQPDFLNWKLNDLPKLREFYNMHIGEDCFIICNGPSLNKTDLSRLNGYHVIGLNKIFMIFDKYKIDLDYLVAVNPLVIEQARNEFASMNIPVFLSDRVDVKSAPNFNFLRTRGEFDFSYDFNQVMGEGYTVTYVALQLAYIMGFSRVFIVGADHYFTQTGNPNSEEVMKGDDVNHFHPDYFKGQKWHLADIDGNEISYRIAKRKFEENGRRIYNVTIGGYLEIFERMDYHTALSIAKKK